jgi:hypothetical protein
VYHPGGTIKGAWQKQETDTIPSIVLYEEMTYSLYRLPVEGNFTGERSTFHPSFRFYKGFEALGGR